MLLLALPETERGTADDMPLKILEAILLLFGCVTTAHLLNDGKGDSFDWDSEQETCLAFCVSSSVR